MHSLASIVGAVITRKDAYPDWSRNIKSTFIYNDLCDGIFEGSTIETKFATLKSNPKPPTTKKDQAIWQTREKKELALIVATISKEVSQDILLATSYFDALKILKDLFHSHFELELIYMMLNLFNLEVKYNGLMIVASEIIEIMHKIKATGMQPYLPLVSFIKFLYLTHSHYLEPFQASDKLKDFTFDS